MQQDQIAFETPAHSGEVTVGRKVVVAKGERRREGGKESGRGAVDRISHPSAFLRQAFHKSAPPSPPP